MPMFPIAEPKIAAMAQNMLAGFTGHQEEFPHVTPAGLAEALDEYLAARTEQEDIQGRAQVATEAKNRKLETLIRRMKDDLTFSTADTSSEPLKLALIGWGPKRPPTALETPGEPVDLTAAVKEGELTLRWKKPQSGGPVRNYIVQRRVQDEQGIFGNWQILDFAYEPSITLTGQPEQTRIEFRVKASNTTGESAESNTVSVVL